MNNTNDELDKIFEKMARWYDNDSIEMGILSPDKAKQAIKAYTDKARIDEVMLVSRMAQASSGDNLLENINNRLKQLKGDSNEM